MLNAMLKMVYTSDPAILVLGTVYTRNIGGNKGYLVYTLETVHWTPSKFTLGK